MKIFIKNNLKIYLIFLILVALVTLITQNCILLYNKSVFFDNSIPDITDKFENILQHECNVDKESTQQDLCLGKLSQLDNEIRLNQFEFHDECQECLIHNNQKLIVYHHTFWQINDKLESPGYNFKYRVLLLNIMSYFSTQNLCCTKLFFWKLPHFPTKVIQILNKKFHKFIKKDLFEIQDFDLISLCNISKSMNKSVIYKYPLCKMDHVISQNNLVSLSDLVRFVVLDIYGGIYTDGDVIYMKQTNFLWRKNFAYRWSYTNYINTAVLGINKNLDDNINKLYDLVFKKSKSLKEIIRNLHPFSLSLLDLNDDYKNPILKIYHSFLFDPAWLCFDGKVKHLNKEAICGFQEFNNEKKIDEKKFNPDDFFGGSFTYHLHLVNCGNNIRNDSYFQYFENYFEKNLRLD
ncbi:unnamed protein product [Brachionus calyciflorus]|uniref:Uncharacterized protein n=1 Tax=Brachionus calyciflorus TaxID=104777 RepID=A0A813MTV5_9BILA|nr:unnamed protein product [Brachionus calyciflorus]